MQSIVGNLIILFTQIISPFRAARYLASLETIRWGSWPIGGLAAEMRSILILFANNILINFEIQIQPIPAGRWGRNDVCGIR